MTDDSSRRPDIRDGTNDRGGRLITKMPTQSNLTQIRLDNIKTCLTSALATVDVVSQGLKTPFLEPIVNTTRSLLGAVQVCFRH
jgi:hypothetical protein